MQKSRHLNREYQHTLRRYDNTDRGTPFELFQLGRYHLHIFGWIQDEVIGLSMDAKIWKKIHMIKK